MTKIKRKLHGIQFIFLKNVIGYLYELESVFNDSIMLVILLLFKLNSCIGLCSNYEYKYFYVGKKYVIRIFINSIGICYLIIQGFVII